MIAHLRGRENRAGALRLDRTPVHRAEWIALDDCHGVPILGCGTPRPAGRR